MMILLTFYKLQFCLVKVEIQVGLVFNSNFL